MFSFLRALGSHKNVAKSFVFPSVSCTQHYTNFFILASLSLKQFSAKICDFDLNPAWQIGTRVREAALPPPPQKSAVSARFGLNPAWQIGTRVREAALPPPPQKSAVMARIRLNPAWQVGQRAREAVLPPPPRNSSVLTRTRWQVGVSPAPATTLGNYLEVRNRSPPMGGLPMGGERFPTT